MACVEHRLLLRAARNGVSNAQLLLGKRYLIGETGTARNNLAALHWLDMAAQHGESEAWMLIGRQIPYEIAKQAPRPFDLYIWYELAFDDGALCAGLVMAQLVFAQDKQILANGIWDKALTALHIAANAGIAEAQWLWALQTEVRIGYQPNSRIRQSIADSEQSLQLSKHEWISRAAENGILPAQKMLALNAWNNKDYSVYLRWAIPIAEAIEISSIKAGPRFSVSNNDDILLLSRCSQALFFMGNFEEKKIERFGKLAALAGDKTAQYILGLCYAKMGINGRRDNSISLPLNYKNALHWLMKACQQEMAEAHYAISQLYLRTEFPKRNPSEAQQYLKRSAELGCPAAQLASGKIAWRTRHTHAENDAKAAYWLQQAAGQGNQEAQVLLRKITSPATVAPWALDAKQHLKRDASVYLVARIELAVVFGLSRAEALLLDVNAADCQSVLVVDIRCQYARSKRRLILIKTAEERQLLNRIGCLFENVNCGPGGIEGNYRQRLYRLQSALSRKAELDVLN